MEVMEETEAMVMRVFVTGGSGFIVPTPDLAGWGPSHPGLLDDLAHGDFFPTAARSAGGGQP